MSLRHMRLVVNQEQNNDSKLDNIIVPGIITKSNKQKEKERKKKAELAEIAYLKQLELEDNECGDEEFIFSDEEINGSNEQQISNDKTEKVTYEDDDNDGVDKKNNHSSANLFDMLEKDTQSEGVSSKDESTSSSEEEDTSISTDSPSQQKQLSSSARKRNKRNKRKVQEVKEQKPEEDIEALTKELFGDDYVPQKVGNEGQNKIMNVTVRHLCFHSETNKKFGEKNVRNIAPINRDKAHKNYMRPGIFIRPMDEWPKFINSGIRMIPDDKPTINDGGKYFVFVHDESYQKKQFEFLDAVDTFRQESMIELMYKNPYHIDTLLQVSDIMLVGEERKKSAEFIYRAVYVLERAFHSTFDMSSGDCRLDFNKRENRGFYVTMFRHMNFVSNLSCYRTALEICKLIYSLDQRDPLGILLIMDNMALMAKKFKFIVNLYEESKNTDLVKKLPNWCFSTALSLYSRSKFTRIAKDERKQLRALADKMLKETLLKFPGMLLTLCKACYIKLDDKISKHELFKPDYLVPDGLKLLYALYAARCNGLWKIHHMGTPDWLVNTAMQAMDTYDEFRITKAHEIKQMYYIYHGPIPNNVCRHVIMSDLEDVKTLLPKSIRNKTILSYDPLPPKDSIEAYTRPKKTKEERKSTIPSGYTAFFQSMLPNMSLDDIINLAGQANQEGNPNPVGDLNDIDDVEDADYDFD